MSQYCKAIFSDGSQCDVALGAPARLSECLLLAECPLGVDTVDKVALVEPWRRQLN